MSHDSPSLRLVLSDGRFPAPAVLARVTGAQSMKVQEPHCNQIVHLVELIYHLFEILSQNSDVRSIS
jgi:hypothetical protein